MRAIDRESFDFFLRMFLGKQRDALPASTAKECRELSEHLTEHAGLHTLAENLDRGCVMLTDNLATHQLLDFVFAKKPRTKRGFYERSDINLGIGSNDSRHAR